MPATIFKDFDLAGFWAASDYALKEYVEAPFSAEMLASVEQELGYKLPAAYVALMQTQNGGIPVNTEFPTSEPTSWADDHIAITGLAGIGRTKTYSLCGELGSQFMLDEWGYPAIGVCICDCPSAGHDMVMLDYSACGPQGEPTVVHVDQEADYAITYLAPDFEAFIRGLVNEEVYDTSAADLQQDLARVQHGAFSPLLTELIARQPGTDFGAIIRAISHQLTTEKGFFALHADELSTLLYDVQFLLYSQAQAVTSKAAYAAIYPSIIALADGEFSTGGYAPGFIEDWFDKRLAEGKITTASSSGHLTLSEAYEHDLRQQLAQYA
jgi:hypothetical protein